MIRKLLESVGLLEDSASNEGCEPPLTVVDEGRLQQVCRLADQIRQGLDAGVAHIELADIKWSEVFGPDEFPDAFLKGNMILGGVSFHVEADAVCVSKDGIQQGLCCDLVGWASWVDDESIDGGPFRTVRIGEHPHDYAVRILPHNS